MTPALIVALSAVLQASPSLQMRPQPAAQGDIVVVEAMAAPLGVGKSIAGAPTAEADPADSPPGARYTHFFPGGGHYLALLGVDAEAPQGTLPLTVRWPEGESRQLALHIRKKKFPSERLTVEPRYVEPPAEVTARIVEEKERLERFWRRPSGPRLWTAPFRRPLEGVPNSTFGLQRIFNGQPRSPHNGVDFPAAAGLPIAAANAGEVAVAEELYFTGNTVVLDHGLGLYTVYAHLSEVAVRPGDRVEQGAIIGRVGATGRATGPHLHWGARLLEARVDPMQLLRIEGEEIHGSSGR